MLLIHFLDAYFKLYYLERSNQSESFVIEGNIFTKDETSNANEGFLGFFDWLRAGESVIVGVRLCFFEDLEYNAILSAFSYIKSSFDGKCKELLFSKRTYIPEQSGDQDFTNNYVYKSHGGEYLFTFSLDALTAPELESLKKYCTVYGQPDTKS